MARPFFPISLHHLWAWASSGAGVTPGKATLESGADKEGWLLPAPPALGDGPLLRAVRAAHLGPHTATLFCELHFYLIHFFNK